MLFRSPDDGLAAADGTLRPEFIWAALDCAGGVGGIGDAPLDGLPFVLGRLSVQMLGSVTPGEPHVVIGWPVGYEGRKVFAGSAIFTRDGHLTARARATWIRLAP